MFKNHPKGLLGAALANMGERFGFYIMMAILALFLSSKFGLSETQGGIIYSIFYALIYILALAGGYIADKTKKYKQTIFWGLILMAGGYFLIAIPTPTPVPNIALYLTLTCGGLLVIAFGNGLFKGNLQAVVGQMYDNDQYRDKRDSGFQIFYMFINVGAMFAPLIAIIIRNIWLKLHGFLYEAKLPELCHMIINGEAMTPEQTRLVGELATKASVNGIPGDLTTFANGYLDVFNTGFQYAFGAAVFAMIISMTIYAYNRNKLPDPSQKATVATGNAQQIQMDTKEIRQRIYALFSVFAIVIFFWFSFHQNGMTLTYFAKDYTNLDLEWLNFSFDLSWINPTLQSVEIKGAEIFQSFNPLYVVFLTPIIIGIFGWLKTKGKEPSTPMKIAIGMGIATLAFVVMAIGSSTLPDYEVMKSGTDFIMASPWLLIGTYFILTLAELFISPLGLSFVSKVAPPHLQGMMQGMWLGATAIGNSILFLGVIFYESFPQWVVWSIFGAACLISMITMLAMVKWLEKVSK